ncbi:MAG: protein kinase, partial [Gemmatimonadetes bacterium]|nr:protein kinase [Gemmatimonadota bacterium]NIR81202.1 protein kinase [Gemmatimonadota bacterium]NIT90050.1 protein kinase [Gemmatimonadota bacterium]NIU33859.1 protein kinase [Gemmatimonadota bacterium]NIU38056.1 protein kinase [Gemmatimonadota bacterium]
MTADPVGALRSALLPRYGLEREIGQGGMATVYLARERYRGRRVVAKVLDPELSSALDPVRFAREIRIIRDLDHPAILPLLDWGKAGELLYYVMPYVEGDSLGDLLDREGPLRVEEALRICREVAAALDYAHDQGVVHRDIKPENILLSGDRVYLSDFGVARVLSGPDSETITKSGHWVGTPAYTSPEQAAGDRTVDRRSDVYSLGCVVHEMLAGEPPFTGPTARAVVARHMTAPPPSLDIVRPDLPPSVVAGVKKALAKTPSDRFPSAGDLAAALEAPRPVASPEERANRWVAGAAVALTLAGVILVPRLFAPAEPPLDPNKVVVFPLVATSEIQDPDAGWEVALALGAALEQTEPLKFIDGWTWLDEAKRRDPAAVTTEVASELSRSRGAGHYIVGAIRSGSDSLSVILRLHDVRGDSLVAQESESELEVATTPAHLGMAAVPRLLARLVEPDRPIDLTPLTNRAPAAIALSIQGDRQYRQSRFAEALHFYERAVDEDSLHAFAATKGAQAASWSNRFADAERLIGVALQNDTLLPKKYEHFAEGLGAYIRGQADEAINSFRAALTIHDDWSEAATALGEVYYHLLPGDAVRPDSLAGSWLAMSWSGDSTFAPPLYHLSEIALRAGDTDTASRYLTSWRRFDPDTILLRQVEYSLECLRSGPADFDWAGKVPEHLRSVLQAGLSLAGGARRPGCARGAFAAAYRPDSSRPIRWAALRGLYGQAVAQGRYEEADSLLRTGIADGLGPARRLYVLGALSAAPFSEQARAIEAYVRQRSDEMYRGEDVRWR